MGNNYQVHNPFLHMKFKTKLSDIPGCPELAKKLYETYMRHWVDYVNTSKHECVIKRMMNHLKYGDTLTFLCPCENQPQHPLSRCHAEVLKQILLEWHDAYLQLLALDEEAQDLLNMYDRLYPPKKRKNKKQNNITTN